MFDRRVRVWLGKCELGGGDEVLLPLISPSLWKKKKGLRCAGGQCLGFRCGEGGEIVVRKIIKI